VQQNKSSGTTRTLMPLTAALEKYQYHIQIQKVQILYRSSATGRNGYSGDELMMMAMTRMIYTVSTVTYDCVQPMNPWHVIMTDVGLAQRCRVMTELCGWSVVKSLWFAVSCVHSLSLSDWLWRPVYRLYLLLLPDYDSNSIYRRLRAGSRRVT